MKKNTWFKLIFATLPLVILILLELVFRLIGLFAPEPLFNKITARGIPHFQVNPYVARRYFDPDKVTVPTLYPETFVQKKQTNMFRVFCLGGSTTAGFPFEYQVPFPHQLKNLLQQQYPDHGIEVINLGISAVNSFTVLDLLPEILEKDPDLILIYMGHNEFYGAYGSASTLSVGQNGAYIRFYLQLKSLRWMQLLQKIFKRFSGSPAPSSATTTLMESMIADKSVAYGSDKYRTTLANYRANLNLILESCQEKNIPVFIGNLFSNLTTYPPFGSVPVSTSNSGLQQKTRIADSLFNAADYNKCIPVFSEILRQDSASAKIWYQLGMSYYHEGDSILAKHYLSGARDRDLIRFRAGKEMNPVIQKAAETHGAVYVDLARTFTEHSPLNIPNKKLLCDHLHPNPDGYALMAKAFADPIIAKKILKSYTIGKKINRTIITELDWDIGLIKIYKLIHGWPFADKEVDYSLYHPYGNKRSGEVAYHYVFEENHWVKAHYAMAEYYLEKEMPAKARQEYLAITTYDPEYPDAYVQVGKTYEQEKNWAASEYYYTKGLPIRGKEGQVYLHLALVQWQQRKVKAAINNIQNAIVSKDLSLKQKQAAKFHLAGFLTTIQQFKEAVLVLNDILREDPGFQPAQKLLHNIQSQK